MAHHLDQLIEDLTAVEKIVSTPGTYCKGAFWKDVNGEDCAPAVAHQACWVGWMVAVTDETLDSDRVRAMIKTVADHVRWACVAPADEMKKWDDIDWPITISDQHGPQDSALFTRLVIQQLKTERMIDLCMRAVPAADVDRQVAESVKAMRELEAA